MHIVEEVQAAADGSLAYRSLHSAYSSVDIDRTLQFAQQTMMRLSGINQRTNKLPDSSLDIFSTGYSLFQLHIGPAHFTFLSFLQHCWGSVRNMTKVAVSRKEMTFI